jgi:uncharacterized protein YciI
MFIADPTKRPTDCFMYALHPARPAMLTEGSTDAEKAMAAQHWAHSIELLRKGVIIFAGRTMTTTPDSFAQVVIRAKSEADARAIMNSDPAVKGGLFRGKLFPFQPMLIASQE